MRASTERWRCGSGQADGRARGHRRREAAIRRGAVVRGVGQACGLRGRARVTRQSPSTSTEAEQRPERWDREPRGARRRRTRRSGRAGRSSAGLRPCPPAARRPCPRRDGRWDDRHARPQGRTRRAAPPGPRAKEGTRGAPSSLRCYPPLRPSTRHRRHGACGRHRRRSALRATARARSWTGARNPPSSAASCRTWCFCHLLGSGSPLRERAWFGSAPSFSSLWWRSA